MTLPSLLRNKKHNEHKKLYQMYANSVYHLCLRYLSCRQDAEDMVAVTFMKAFAKMDMALFNHPKMFWGWIRKIAINECLMFIRKRENFCSLSMYEFEQVDVSEDVISKLEVDQLLMLIQQLPKGYRTVFNLYVIDCYTHKEIAELLGITEGTSKSQLSKARNLLQSWILKQNRYE